MPAKVVTDIIESIGSKPLGEVIEGQLRFPLVVRLPERLRAGASGIGSILIPTASGERLPLSRLADIRIVEGPSTITRESGQRRITVSANVRGRDIGSFVAEARAKLKTQFQLPPGRYSYEFGGQFEHLQRARTRLLIVVPVALMLILGPAVHDISKHRRRAAGVHRRAVRLGRRHFRAVAARHAIFDFRRDRLHRPFRRGGAGCNDSRELHPATARQRIPFGTTRWKMPPSRGCGRC